MTFSVMVNLHHSIIEDLQNCIAFLVSVAFLSFNPGLTCYCWAVEGGRDVHFQFWLQHSPGITLKSPPKIQSFNTGHTCYCWLVEGRRDVHFIPILVTTFMDDYRHTMDWHRVIGKSWILTLTVSNDSFISQ